MPNLLSLWVTESRLRSNLATVAPARIHAHLQNAVAELESSLGPSPTLGELRQKVRALETAYG